MTDSAEETVDEIRQLRGCINDLVSLLALPAMWSDHEPLQIVETLLDTLVGILRLDFIYARLNAGTAAQPIEAVRLPKFQPEPAVQPPMVDLALASWLTSDPFAYPITVPNPIGEGKVNLARFSLGLQDSEEAGLLMAGSSRADFPTDTETLLLRVAADQATIALKGAQLASLRAQAEISLREQTEVVETILESITESFMVFDKDWCYTFLNREAEKLLLRMQIPGSEVMGKNLWDRFPDLAGSVVYEQFHHAVAAQVPVECEMFYPPLNGWLNIRAYPSSEGLTVYMQDITARKEAEAKFVEQQEQFLTLAESIPQLAWMAGPDGYIHWYNRRWYEYTGATREEMEGWGWQSVHDPDVLPRVLERWKASIASGEPFDMVFPLRGADGVFRPFLTRVMPQLNQGGQVIQWFGTNTDIDEVKRAEAALRRSEQRARFLAQASADFAELTDYKSTLQKVAAIAVPAFADWCAVDLINSNGALQRLVVKHTDPAKVRLAHELMERYPPQPDDPYGVPYVVRTGKAQMIEEIADSLLVETARDEEHLRIASELGLKSYICVPMRSKGKTLGVLTFVMAESGRLYNTDDLLAAEDLGRRAAIVIENAGLYRALQDAARRKDEFLATLAHELRNPLAPIRAGLHALKLAKNDPVIAEDASTMMNRQLNHMVRLVDDLLDVSRITRGKLELRMERVELTTVVQNAVEASRPLIDQQGHELTLVLPPTTVFLDADPTRLAQVLENLLNNAAKYSEKGSHIMLTAVQEDEEIVLSVKDTGIGILPNHLPGIFEMFSQVDTALEKAQGGLGIGLSLVKGLVEMHGGKIEARSEGPGQGSQFVVRLPILLERKATASGQDEMVKEAKRSGAHYRILVVDDNEDSADWLATMLTFMGNEVRTAHDGEAGIAVAAAFRPDLILMDIGMPKMNGYEAAQRIRQEAWGKQPVLVALTGWGADDDRRRTQDAGFNRHLVKPVGSVEIEKLLAELSAI